jgi:hypothetical protein
MVSHRMGDQIYYLELLRALEGTLSRWSPLHWQSLAPTPISRRVYVRQAAQHDEKHVVPTLLSGIRVGKRKKKLIIDDRTVSITSDWRKLSNFC